jgi:ABC-type phosphate transport system substrate-binding protein
MPIRRPARTLLLALAIAGVTGCAPGQEPTPASIQHVGVGPMLEASAASWVRASAQANGIPSFDLEPWLEEAGMAALEDGTLDLLLTGRAPPPEWFATPLWVEGIAVVVHPSNPLRAFTLTELARLFRGGIQLWSELGGPDVEVQPVIPFPGEGIRQRFEEQVLEGGSMTPNAILALDPPQALATLLDHPGGVAILPASQVTNAVRLARVEGSLPGQTTLSEARYPLTMTVLAVAPSEPAGAIREWLAWVQAEQAP